MSDLRPFERTGNSANIVYYRERGDDYLTRPYVWASVLESAVDFRVKPPQVKPASDYTITVYRTDKRGEVGRIDYARSRGHGELAPRTVAGLVREVLAR